MNDSCPNCSQSSEYSIDMWLYLSEEDTKLLQEKLKQWMVVSMHSHYDNAYWAPKCAFFQCVKLWETFAAIFYNESAS